MFYNQNDLLDAVNNFKILDVEALVNQCNEWNISPYEIKDNADSLGFENIDDINILFYSLYNLRLNQLIEKVEDVEIELEEKDQEIFNNFKEKIIEELQEANIHTNCLASCFDDDLARTLDETDNVEETLLEIFQEREEIYFK